MRHQYIARTALTAVLILGCSTWTGYSDDKDDQARAGRIAAGARMGDDTQEYYVDLLLPALRSDDTVLFLDVRGTFLEDIEQELNAGLVVRHLFDDRIILGANGFYDTRWTDSNNTFEQVGAGVELLSRWVDMRFNYYYPVVDSEKLSESSETSTTVSSSGGKQTTTTVTEFYDVYEEALEGYDAELGFWLPILRDKIPTAAYVGYYEFSSDYERDISGFKGRLESRIHPNVTLDAEWFENDELNRTDYFVGVRFRLPLDFWNGVSLSAKNGGESSRGSSLRSRMNDMVNRDFRIRTIITDPVLVREEVQTSVKSTGGGSSDEPSSESDPGNCRIDPITGDVVCD